VAPTPHHHLTDPAVLHRAPEVLSRPHLHVPAVLAHPPVAVHFHPDHPVVGRSHPPAPPSVLPVPAGLAAAAEAVLSAVAAVAVDSANKTFRHLCFTGAFYIVVKSIKQKRQRLLSAFSAIGW